MTAPKSIEISEIALAIGKANELVRDHGAPAVLIIQYLDARLIAREPERAIRIADYITGEIKNKEKSSHDN